MYSNSAYSIVFPFFHVEPQRRIANILLGHSNASESTIKVDGPRGINFILHSSAWPLAIPFVFRVQGRYRRKQASAGVDTTQCHALYSRVSSNSFHRPRIIDATCGSVSLQKEPIQSKPLQHQPIVV